LRGLPPVAHADLLVGTATADDAGVFRIAPDLALVQTVDFFTPIVDDAFQFGAIAAANALSDVYAMGGEPRTALNIACFPQKGVPFEILTDILRGGLAKAEEAGVVVVGGHTVIDEEIKFGMAVTGLVHPDRILRNVGARPGGALAAAGHLTGGCQRNREWLADDVEMAPGVPADLAEVAWDPQTSGGLLAAVPAATAPRVLDALAAAGVPAAAIGSVEARAGGAWVALR